jgi:NADH:ubiquinone oxidoreductase subunit 2 (subunit N)
MSLNLQQYIMTLINTIPSGAGFLNLHVISNSADTAALIDYTLASTLSYIFISADILLYVGIVAVIILLGLSYHKNNMISLSSTLIRASALFLYCSLLTNLLGFAIGFDFLCTYNLLVLESSYTFSMFSQILKVIMLLILGALYILFPTILPTKMRVLELPVLLQISAALSSTIISSTNFALLLLALEGFSLTLYIMTALGRNYGGVTASVKYFAFGTLGSIFLFWGVVHLYAIVPSLCFEVTRALLVSAHGEISELSAALDFASTAIAFGFMIKLGAAPVHQ